MDRKISIANDDAVRGASGLMSLGKAFGFYVGAVLALIAGAPAVGATTLPIVYFAVYFACGIFLNHTVLRNLITFHPVYNTPHNVFSTKVSATDNWRSCVIAASNAT